MLDEFRDLSDKDESGDDSLFEDLDDYADYDGSLDNFDSLGKEEKPGSARSRSSNSIIPTLGLTAQQRFIVSFLVLMTSCLFSMLCLLLTNKIIL